MDLAFIKSQWTTLPYPTHDFTSQTIIVTGANTGLGLEAARHFVRLGASKVILGCRSIAKAEAAIRDIESTTSITGVCEAWQLDLSRYDSVKEFTRKAEGLERLDVVVENAGIVAGKFEEVGGTESTVAVNVVGTFLMALNLLPVLRKSAKKTNIEGRLVIVTSEVHAWASVHICVLFWINLANEHQTPMDERLEESIFEALKKNDKNYFKDRYPTSKLLEVFFVRELVEKIKSGSHAQESVIINLVNPGLCHSELTRNVTGIMAIMMYVMKLLLARTTEVGSRNLVAGACAGPESNGKYMLDCKIGEPSPFVKSEEGGRTQKRVYKELIDVLEGIQAGISKNI